MIDTVALDTSDQRVTRSRVEDATASYFPANRRIVLVADKDNWSAAFRALTELRDHFGAETDGEHYNRLNGLE